LKTPVRMFERYQPSVEVGCI